MDDIDRANDLVELEASNAISNILAKQASVKDSADCCEECGEEIPSECQIAVPGCSMCIHCASEYESKSKNYRH